jgi:hypothetical protein
VVVAGAALVVEAGAVVEAAAPASNDMLLVLTRIAVALEALVSKGS